MMSLSNQEFIECRYIGLFRISKSISYRTSHIEYLDILKTNDFFVFFRRKFQKFSENSPKIQKTHEPKSSTNPSTNPPTNPPTHQPTHQPTNPPTNPPTHPITHPPIHPPQSVSKHLKCASLESNCGGSEPIFDNVHSISMQQIT